MLTRPPLERAAEEATEGMRRQNDEAWARATLARGRA